MFFLRKQHLFLRIIKIVCSMFFLLLCNRIAVAQPTDNTINNRSDSLRRYQKDSAFPRQLGLAFRTAHTIHSNPFYRTDYSPELSVGAARSVHLNYSFALPEGSFGNQVFPHTHQGIGAAVFDFGNRRELGIAMATYLFQRSRIAPLSGSLSLDYAWNFGLSTGWKPYDPERNPNNIIVGSKVNAYINLGTSLRWQFADRLAVTGGVDFTHFSNGNTEYPNAGVNLAGVQLGVIYDVAGSDGAIRRKDRALRPRFPRHLSYDMVLFGSWRRKGVDFFGAQVASPYKYAVLGGYFAPMYNWGYRLRTGISLDALYDGSANVYTEDYIIGTQQEFFTPPLDRQIALGMSARVEYLMPFFTIGIGVGTNVLHKGGDLRGTYQTFALKIRAIGSSFVHIGYNVKDFHDPNYLMLGLGYRFNDRAPSLLSR